MPCPNLLREDDKFKCKAGIYRIIENRRGERKVDYQTLTSSEAQKCQDPKLYPKCPDYRKEVV